MVGAAKVIKSCHFDYSYVCKFIYWIKFHPSMVLNFSNFVLSEVAYCLSENCVGSCSFQAVAERDRD